MNFGRRDFLKMAAATSVAYILNVHKLDIMRVFAQYSDYIHICWLNGAGCTGCSVSLAQAADPDLLEVLTSITTYTSGLPIALPDWMYVVHPASGSLAVEYINDWRRHGGSGPKILVVEGAMQEPGFCETGGRDFREWVADTAAEADYIVAFGSCSSFGGIPHAVGNPTGAMGVQEFLREVGMGDKADGVINLPRCPGHPDSLILTLASVLQGIVPELDQYNRPVAFYGKNIHDELCPYRAYYDKGEFASFGDSEFGCRFKIGCKGPVTNADCPSRKWNDNTSFCIEVGAPCIGCSEPEWPDGDYAPFFVELPKVPTLLGYPAETWGTAFLGAAAVGIAAHATLSRLKKGSVKEEVESGGE
jgi:hydrogenase small subunit